MSQPATPQYSYIRCVREVQPTPPLEEFLARARTVGKTIFGTKRGLMVRLPVAWEDELQPNYVPQYEGTSIARVNVFAAHTLHATLFERRGTASEGTNDVLTRAYNRITATTIVGGKPKKTATGRRQVVRRENPLPQALRDKENARGVGGGVLSAVAVGVVESTKSGHGFRGREYSLVIDSESEAGNVLREQAAEIDSHLRKTVVCRPLFNRPEFSPDGDVLHIPFVNVPTDTLSDYELFLDTMNTEANGVAFDLSAPEWATKARPIQPVQ
ncbi:hypothetical protein EYC59_02335 [Candidatus Saccharibacteria bacterium]|nr:MAG: hypothetical protein EYC59_02335 [Candidatus Saccharibacteria bacterium]